MGESYREYLDSDHWQILRCERLKIAKQKCEVCGFPRYLQVHHVRYAPDLHTITTRDLRVLCDVCHSKEHGKSPMPRALEKQISFLATKRKLQPAAPTRQLAGGKKESKLLKKRVKYGRWMKPDKWWRIGQRFHIFNTLLRNRKLAGRAHSLRMIIAAEAAMDLFFLSEDRAAEKEQRREKMMQAKAPPTKQQVEMRKFWERNNSR